MKLFKTGLFSAMIFSVLFFIIKSEEPITDSMDYEKYLNAEFLISAVTKQDEQIDFWKNKLKSASGNSVYQQKIAGLLASKFKLTGDVEYLHRSDSLYNYLHTKFPENVNILHALTANAISKHAFKDAEKYAQKAYQLGEKKFISTLLLMDVNLERGNFLEADRNRRDIASKEHFDYHIRAVKWHDQMGDLDTAVESMESALLLAKSSNNKKLINWSLSNLADMYGHQGRISKSYDTYVEALSYNPTDLHSLKGIAWVAFSSEKNTTEAKRILHFLKSMHSVPDYDLLLSEIAAFEGDTVAEQKYLADFVKKADQPIYGNMYKSYLGSIYGEDKTQLSKALAIADSEIIERPHPMSYSLKAWLLCQDGHPEEGLVILNNYVIDHTEEPDALYRAGLVFEANGMSTKARKYFNAAADAAYELGPVTNKTIENYLRSI